MNLWAVLQPALLIFVLRLIDVSLMVLRVLMVMRGRKAIAWATGFFQAIVFVVAIRQVMADLGNWVNIISYAAGFATGNVIGMWIEERLAVGYGHVNVTSSRYGAVLAERLRAAGFAVTQISGRGRDGTVDILSCSVPRRQVNALKQEIVQIDPEAFITIENVHPIHRGFWRRK